MRITEFPMIEEIREEYLRCRRDGCSRRNAVAQLMHSYHNEITVGCEDDQLLFWIGLADAQYSCKELSEDIAKQGLAAIEKIQQTDWQVSAGDLERRRAHYASAPMPERKRFGKPRKFRCSWQLGDVFAFQMSGPDAEARGLAGRYLILRKVDALEFGDGSLYPVVTVTMWDEQALPTNSKEFQRLPYLAFAKGRFGYSESLYEYRAELLISSKRKLDQMPLIFLGNFQDVQMPANELILRRAGLAMMISLERLELDCCVAWERRNRYKKQN